MAPRVGGWVITIIAGGGLLVQPAFSQARGGATSTGSTSGGTTGAGSTGIKTPTPTTTTPTTTTPSTTTTVPQPIYVTGRVLMEDGNPPTESVTIERICSGSPHAEGYTDSRGYFGITLGQATGVIQDASEGHSSSGGFGDPNGSSSSQRLSTGGPTAGGAASDMRYMACDLRAKLSGFRSQSISLANRRAMDNPDIGIILLHRLLPTEGTTISSASLNAPKDARKAFEKGEDAIKKKKWDEAAKSFQKAVDVYPGYATAWYELGRLQAAGGAPDTARISLECALKADPKFAAPYVELASIEVQAKKWKDVATFSDRGLRLDSFDYPELFFYNAVANYYLRNADVAEKNARQAVKLDNQHRYPQSSYLLGLILTQRRAFQDAAEQFRDFLKLAPEASDAASAKQKLEQLAQISAQGGAPTPKIDEPKQDR
jgi:tetratricopeptide (TPR) repeat protein